MFGDIYEQPAPNERAAKIPAMTILFQYQNKAAGSLTRGLGIVRTP
jgi:hypothetical protein